MKQSAIAKAYDDFPPHYSHKTGNLSLIVRCEDKLDSGTSIPRHHPLAFRLKIAAMASLAACDNRNIMGDQDLL